MSAAGMPSSRLSPLATLSSSGLISPGTTPMATASVWATIGTPLRS